MPEQHLGFFGKRKAADTPYVSRHRGKFWGSTKGARETPGNGEFDRFRRSGDGSSGVSAFCLLSSSLFPSQGGEPDVVVGIVREARVEGLMTSAM